ncbi:MAG: hypothetical protein WBI14_01260 [Anaerolineaceae bacterium]
MTEHRQRMALQAQALTADRFEILAITAGVANGWEFQPEALKASLELWEGVNCFIDHDLGARSVRDIAGVLRKVGWDETNQGVKAEIQAFGPSKALLKEIGRQVLEESDEPAVKVGFSADILFRSKGKQVDEILKVYSVDLVYNPARGGVFLRALNQLGLNFQTQGGLGMQTFQEQEVLTTPNTEAITQESQGVAADLQTQLAEMRQMRAEMSAWVAETMLGNSQLPIPVKDRLKKQFNGRTFAPAELQTAIREARTMLMELDPGKAVNGPARIEGMVDSGERVQAAVDDLFGAPRAAHLHNLSVPRLSGIRELYLSLTGDTDLHGGYHPERAQLATTLDFSGLVKNSLNKLVANTWEELGKAGYDWWKDISVQEHFNSLHDISGTLIGTVGDLPTVAEGANYPELLVGDSPETAAFTKYGGYIPLTLELIDRDETRKLRAYARELASAGMRKISRLVADIFTANAGVGPAMADGENLFNTNLVTTANGHANLSAEALSQTNWDAVSAKVYKQPMLIKRDLGLYGTGPMMAVNPKFLLVSRANQKTAMEICTGALVREATYVYDNVLKGSAVPVVVPEWTDDNDWAAVCDPRVAPAIFIAERFGIAPEIFIAGDELSPAVFSNDQHRLKVRHFLAVWVNDFRPLHKCNVA